LALPQPNGSVTALTGVTFTKYLSEELLIYGGKLNTQDDFEQPLTGASNLTGFQNTAMLYNPVFARTIPYSTFGAGFDCLQDEETVFAACVYDTNDTPTASGFDTFFDNGATVYAELNLPTTFFDRPGHQGLSGTYSSGKYTSLTPSAYLDPIEGLVIVPALKAGSWCLAYNFDQALYVSPEDPQRMWGVFGNFGIADSNPSPVRWFASAGISGASQIAGRNADSFGIAYFYVGVSDPLKNLAPLLLPLRDEQGVELYYNVVVTPWFQIAPDLQVITPFRERANTLLLFGLRAMIDFWRVTRIRRRERIRKGICPLEGWNQPVEKSLDFGLDAGKVWFSATTFQPVRGPHRGPREWRFAGYWTWRANSFWVAPAIKSRSFV
jgi:porin